MLNDLFSIVRMVTKKRDGQDRSIDRALRRAKELGWNQSDFARQMGVLAAHVTNWKARGMPPSQLEAASKILSCSVDYLLGQEPKKKSNLTEAWPFESVSFSDYTELEHQQKLELQEIVEDRIARFKAKNGPRHRRKSNNGE